MSFDPHTYSVAVRTVKVDGRVLFEYRVVELPDISGYAKSSARAYSMAIDAIETLHEMTAAAGESLPPPAEVEEDFSGRVTLRVAKTLHRSLALSADAEGCTLNSYITTILSAGLASYLARPATAFPATQVVTPAVTPILRTAVSPPATQESSPSYGSIWQGGKQDQLGFSLLTTSAGGNA